MKHPFLIILAAWLLLLFALLAFCISYTPKKPTPSPSYWHWLDSVDPREDTMHYLTYEEAMPGEVQE